MADSNEPKPVVPVQRSTKPVSEALLNEKVQHHIVLDLSFISVAYPRHVFDRHWTGRREICNANWTLHSRAPPLNSQLIRPSFPMSSGIAPYPRCLSVPRSVSRLVLSSRFSCSSAERGPRGSVLVSELDVRGKRQTVCQQSPGCLWHLTNKYVASFRRGDSPLRDALRR